MIANTHKSPYAAAVFTSIRADIDEAYDKMNKLLCTELDSLEG